MVFIMKSLSDLDYKVVDKNNIELAYNIQKSVWPEDPDYNDFLDKVNNTSSSNASWLVYHDDNVIGLTGVYTEDIDDKSIWLDWFCIIPQYRGNGYGEQVLLDTINYCKKLEYLYFRVDTTSYENRPAIFLYDKVMDLREDYTIEDTEEEKNQYLIYTYALKGKVKPWNNRYLGLNEYYEECTNLEQPS